MVNNNEAGVLIDRAQDVELYREAYEEAQRIIRISEEIRISLERVDPTKDLAKLPADKTKAAPVIATPAKPGEAGTTGIGAADTPAHDKLTSAKLAAKHGLATRQMLDRFVVGGLLEVKNDRHYVSAAGKHAGVEWRPGPGGGYLVWPAETQLPAE
jgi:hypothetical protein